MFLLLIFVVVCQSKYWVTITHYGDEDCDRLVMEPVISHPTNVCVPSIDSYAIFMYKENLDELVMYECEDLLCGKCTIRDVDHGHCDGNSDRRYDVTTDDPRNGHKINEHFYFDRHEKNGVGECSEKTLSAIFSNTADKCTNVYAGTLDQNEYLRSKMIDVVVNSKRNNMPQKEEHRRVGGFLHSEMKTCVRGNVIREAFTLENCFDPYGQKEAIVLDAKCDQVTPDSELFYHTQTCGNLI